MIKYLQNIAIRARERFDSQLISIDTLATLYQSYNHLEDVDTFVTRGLRIFPHFCCGLASVYLKAHIGYGQVVYGRYHTDGHSFLLIGKGVIVDITADQYGGPKVYVGSLRSPWSLETAAYERSELHGH